MYVYIYIYTHVCICMYIYIYNINNGYNVTYTFDTIHHNNYTNHSNRNRPAPPAWRSAAARSLSWPPRRGSRAPRGGWRTKDSIGG